MEVTAAPRCVAGTPYRHLALDMGAFRRQNGAGGSRQEAKGTAHLCSLPRLVAKSVLRRARNSRATA